ncbi:Fic family protein [Pedobacter sp. SD-b]|uniref:Fic family protein n=1 Tax=Pedobacter segetis TaxID=2793069 RepID=A0ABS1BGQ7_9SPHI|nr:Fic family protein [Pedobacter segetis]MBK0382049.1 Fic family protein [Pedobacter segetis]
MRNFDKNKPYNALPNLPPKVNLETIEILKASIEANKILAELKGYCQTLPNPNLLLNTLVLQESKESSAIENIVTTQDELYQETLRISENIKNAAAKEVIQYREAMYWGLEEMQKNGLITTNLLVGVMQRLRATDENIRNTPGTKLANPTNNLIVYTPPESEQIIREKLKELEQFMNDDEFSDLDILIKMALVHYQFEAIHPFSDGNGRTGRILNVLYLINQKMIGLPVLYLSYYIIKNKSDYYRLLREVTEKGNWAEWVLFIVKGVGETASLTLKKINAILQLKAASEEKIKKALKASYSRELCDLLFSYPYIKIKILEEYHIAKRQTASDYLRKLEKAGLLEAVKIGKETYYINTGLMEILTK